MMKTAACLLGLSLALCAQDMEAWAKLNAPGDMHKILDSMAGDFDVETTLVLDPSAPPVTSKATCKNVWIMGGRFLESHFKGDFMGQAFEGRGWLGHDNLRGVFVSNWIDSTSSQLMVSDGSLSEDKKTITLEGSMNNPENPEHGFKCVYILESHDKHVFEMYDVQGDQETKQMTMVYTRKK